MLGKVHTYITLRVCFTATWKTLRTMSDTWYAKSGLGIKLEREVSSTHKKVTKDMAAKEKRFWSRVELGTLLKVLQFYKEDLMLFGYSAADYFEELGLLKILDV